MRVVNYLQDLDVAGPVRIYGAGERGGRVRAWFERHRPQVPLGGFLSSFDGGAKDGLPITRFADYRPGPDDFIVVASDAHAAIVEALEQRGVDRYAVYLPGPERPQGVLFQLSRQCRLRCRFCGWKAWRGNDGFMEMDLYRRVLGQCRECGIQAVTLVGPQGESMLHPRVLEMIDLAVATGLEVVLCTTGNDMGEAEIRHILHSGLGSLKFSFCGFDPESYQRIYCGGDFAKVVGNIRSILRIIRTENLDFTFHVSGIFPHAARRWYEYADFRERCRRFYETLDPGLRWDITDEPHNFAGRVESGPLAPGRAIHSARDLGGKSLAICRSIFSVGVLADGRVTACGCLDANGEMLIGDAGREPLQDILAGPAWREIFEAFRRGDVSHLELCRNCDEPYA